MRRFISLVAFGMAASAASAQQAPAGNAAPIQLKVGDLDSSRLKPYVSEWRVVEVAKDGIAKESQRSFDRLAKVTVQGRPAWRQHQYELPSGGGFEGHSDFKTFAPIDAYERAADGGYRKLTYRADSVHLECRSSRCPPDLRDGAVHRREIATAQATFDYWGGTYGLLLALVPLEVGKSYALPVLHPARGLIQLRVDVEGRETIKAANGDSIDAFRLRTPLTGWVYHLTDGPPYWVRLEYARPDGTRQITERLDGVVRRDGRPASSRRDLALRRRGIWTCSVLGRLGKFHSARRRRTDDG